MKDLLTQAVALLDAAVNCAAECPNSAKYTVKGKGYCYPHWLSHKQS